MTEPAFIPRETHQDKAADVPGATPRAASHWPPAHKSQGDDLLTQPPGPPRQPAAPPVPQAAQRPQDNPGLSQDALLPCTGPQKVAPESAGSEAAPWRAQGPLALLQRSARGSPAQRMEGPAPEGTLVIEERNREFQGPVAPGRGPHSQQSPQAGLGEQLVKPRAHVHGEGKSGVKEEELSRQAAKVRVKASGGLRSAPLPWARIYLFRRSLALENIPGPSPPPHQVHTEEGVWQLGGLGLASGILQLI